MGRSLNGNDLGKGIIQAKSGLYIARRSYSDGTNICISGKDLSSVKKNFQKAIEKKENKQDIFDEKYTIREWFYIWCKIYREPYLREISCYNDKLEMEKTYLKLIGEKKLDELKVHDIQETTNQLFYEKIATRRSIKRAASLLNNAYEAAARLGMVKRNPADCIVVPRQELKPPKEERFLHEDELKVFLATIEKEWFREMYLVMLCTGIRTGEAAGLKWKDIDMAKCKITLRQAIHCDYINGEKKLYLGRLKSSTSYRTLYFDDKIKEALLLQKEKVEKLKSRRGEKFTCVGEFEDLVFCTSTGSPVTKYSLETSLNYVTQKMNKQEKIKALEENRKPIEYERINPHALRHTYATLCKRAGMDLKAIQLLMGHSHMSTTADIYTHMELSDLEREMAGYWEFVNSIG